MRHRLTAIAMAGTLLGTFTLASMSTVEAKPVSKHFVAQAANRNSLLQKVPAEGKVLKGVQTGDFRGDVTITKMKYENKQLKVDGKLNGLITLGGGSPIELKDVGFKNAPVEKLASGGQLKQTGVCDILYLDIGPINLDLLGLTVDLSEITLDVNAESGPGNLLGNLLCSLVGLLDNSPLSGILQIIQQINNLLGSL